MIRLAALAISLALATAGQAASLLPQPTGPVVLTVRGKIGNTNDGGQAIFDSEMLLNLPQTTLKTSTPWTVGVQTFSGPRLFDLLEAVEADGSQVNAEALNDFQSNLPLGDWRSKDAILAISQNGVPLSARDKGPLWVIMPYDESPEYLSEEIYARSIWNLYRIDVLE